MEVNRLFVALMFNLSLCLSWWQILQLFSESAESITGLKGEMAEAKKLLARKNKHLGQFWYRSLTLRHVLSLLDQVEDVAKVSFYLN
jgi:hypothetical protein